MKVTDSPIIVYEVFDVSKDILWNAITEINQMRKWFFEQIPAFDPVVGFETSFMISSPDRKFPHVWKIIEVVPGEKIVYDWSYTGYIGRGAVSFEIEEHGENVKLILTNTTIVDWQHDIPEFSRESAIGGWTYFINQRLKEYVETL